jgi:hypothetical protein
MRKTELMPRQKSFLLSCTWMMALSSCLGQAAGARASYSKRATISRAGAGIHLAANDPRPLAQALDALQQEYGWRINYEDPQFVSALDTTDIPDPQSRTPGSPERIKIPGGHAFSADFATNKTGDPIPDEDKTVHLVVDLYNRSASPGQFEVRKGADRLEVVGIAARDEHGNIARQRVPLDQLITLAVQKRSAFDTVDLICHAIAERSDVKIAVGVFPLGLMNHTNVTVGGVNLPARMLLQRTLTATGQQLVWRLLFDPDSKSYFLNLHLMKHS